VGFFGILQPLVDGLKLLLKDILIPQKSLMILFIISPLLSLILSFSL
jgi:NADH-quinone oxidoreductase subunit H